MRSIIFIFVILVVICCQKDGFDPNITKYVFYGGMSDGHPPSFEIYKSTISSSEPLNFNEYQIVIESSEGERDSMKNGRFYRIKGKAGLSYTISWKLHNDDKWRSFKKQLPYNHSTIFSSSNIKKMEDAITLDLGDVTDFGYFLLDQSIFKRGENNTKKLLSGIHPYSSFYPLELDQNIIKIWPPQSIGELKSPHRSNYKIYNCIYLPDEKLDLYSASKNDIQNAISMTQNLLMLIEPLFIGKNYHLDFKDDTFIALSIFTTAIPEFDFELLRENTDPHKVSFTMNQKELDTNEYKIVNVSVYHQEHGYLHNSLDNISISTPDILAFNSNSIYYQLSLKSQNCFQSGIQSLSLRVAVEKSDKQYNFYYFPIEYRKGVGEQHLIFDIQPF